jgi:hypothetical protein
MDILLKIGNLWVRRKAAPDPMALQAVTGLTPATVVTGASEGLGFSLACLIAREGRTIVLLARSIDMLSDAAEESPNRWTSARRTCPPSSTRCWPATGCI